MIREDPKRWFSLGNTAVDPDTGRYVERPHESHVVTRKARIHRRAMQMMELRQERRHSADDYWD